MNSDQELRLQIAQLTNELNMYRQIAANRGRMFASMFSEGLQVLLAGARGGDPGCQTDLKILRELLQDVDRSGDDPSAKIAIVRRSN
jgi:hypothetical protein